MPVGPNLDLVFIFNAAVMSEKGLDLGVAAALRPLQRRLASSDNGEISTAGTKKLNHGQMPIVTSDCQWRVSLVLPQEIVNKTSNI